MTKIAIIGMGCLFPEADNPEAFFNLLIEKRDVTTPLTEKELGVDPDFYFHPHPDVPDKIGYHKNGYIRNFRFDPREYHLESSALEGLDRICQWPIYAAGQAIEDSGYRNRHEELTRCGIILGNPTFPTFSSKQIFSRMHHLALEPHLQKLLHRNDFSLAEPRHEKLSDENAWTAGLPARIAAQALGLRGPCYEVDAACATSIYVVQLAAYHLLSRHADMMIAGAVCCPDYLYVINGFNVLRAFPPAQAQSLPFDRSSQGMKIGEGAGFLVLKRLMDALRDGDRIHAVVESIGLSNDGRGKHILVPSGPGQILALERAYRGRIRQVDYIECHATGTPLGDVTELATLERFFADAPFLPLLGGSKANIGHTLTVAAMAGILKVVISMSRGIIPATIGVEDPILSPNGRFTEKQIVRDPCEWPCRGGGKIAGIDAFGFGGVNAHMVLTGPPEKNAQSRSVPSMQPLESGMTAIVGMHCRWGNLEGLDALNDAIYHGRQNFQPLRSERWIGGERNRTVLEQEFGLREGQAPPGSYCDAFDLDCLRFKVPPQEANEQLFNHLLMLHVADRALQDAGFSMTEAGRNIAVVIGTKMDWANHRRLTRIELPLYLQRKLRRHGIELSPDQRVLLESLTKAAICPEPTPEGTTGGIGNLAASRISAVWNFTGPSLLISSQENSAYKALQVARFLLTFDPEIEAVLLGAIDLSGGWEHVLWHSRRHKAAGRNQGFAFDAASSGWSIGEGAGALVLKRERDCNENRIYARIRALKIIQQISSGRLDATPDPELVSRACTEAFQEAGISPGQIGYIEAHAGGIEPEDRAELAGLARAYHRQPEKPGRTIGSIKANIGHTFAASGAAALIKAALCLYHEYLPGIPGLRGPKYPELFSQEAFHTLGESRCWHGPARMAAVNGIGSDGSCVHVILGEPTEEQRKIQRTAAPPAEPGEMENRLVKRLVNGWMPMGEFILQETHRKHFPSPPASAAKSPKTACPIDRYIERALRRNAETQLTYSRIKQAFQDDLRSILEREPWESTALKTSVMRREGESRRGESNAKTELVWDAPQILEMTEGRLSAVLGPEYQDIDCFPIRARLPLPPFQFVSRVTRIRAVPGKLEPCSIEWEYDIPRDAWYITDGRVPGIVSFESSHGLILALSYIGCDRLFGGKWRYRALDSTVTFFGSAPLPGDTLSAKANIRAFLRSGDNLFIFYDFHCYVHHREIFKIEANAGFFSQQDQEKVSKWPVREKEAGEEVPGQVFSPLLHCLKTSFQDQEIDALQEGDFASCFGSEYFRQNPGLLGVPRLKMLDRVVSVDCLGGRWGLGEIVGEKDITPDHWVFTAHFKNDPVLPGTMLVEGCNQVLFFYMFYLGLHARFSRVRADFLEGITSTAKFRGEIKPGFTRIGFRLRIRRISAVPETFAVAAADIIHQGRVIGICDRLGVSFHEGEP
jgi:acyl transferase domain-containing protein/3-hydroxymyristoyl/3-hydroxydecanoyl-(acyl carrier protein) dehydratase